MSADLKDFFLATPMEGAEHMQVHCKHFLEDIGLRFNLAAKVTVDGYIHIKIMKGMCSLKQTALLTYNHLKNNLAPHGHALVVGTVGLWKHKTRPTKFCLCSDNFGIKYYNKDDVDHLLKELDQHYNYTTNWEGHHYCGLIFDWDYEDGHVDALMPGHIPEVLKCLGHMPTTHPQCSPHEHIPIQYGTKGT